MNKTVEEILTAFFVAVLIGMAVYAIGGQTKQAKAEVPSSFVVLSKEDIEDGTLMILADRLSGAEYVYILQYYGEHCDSAAITSVIYPRLDESGKQMNTGVHQ